MADSETPASSSAQQTPNTTEQNPIINNPNAFAHADLIPVEIAPPLDNPINPANTPSTSNDPSPPRNQHDLDEMKIREHYASKKAFSHVNTKSTIQPYQLPQIRNLFKIPTQYELRLPTAAERMYWRPDGEWVVMPLWALKYGVRLPLHEFISSFLSLVGVGFAQLVPNSYLHMIAYIAFCQECNMTPGLDFFFALFSLRRTRDPDSGNSTNNLERPPRSRAHPAIRAGTINGSSSKAPTSICSPIGHYPRTP